MKSHLSKDSMEMKQFSLRTCLVSVVVVLTVLLSIFVWGIAENEYPSNIIASFEMPITEVTVPPGTEMSDIPLPQVLEAAISGGTKVSVPVVWTDGGLFDKDIPGTYIFTADIGGYSYPGARPVAVVTVSDELLTQMPLDDVIIDISNPPDGGYGYNFLGKVLYFNSLSTGQVYTITGTTDTNRIVVQAGSAPVIILNGVEITSHTDGAPPFSITNGASPNVRLADGSINRLTSAYTNTGSTPKKNNAALSVPAGNTVTIDGTGTLYANGGAFGAGIGGGGDSDTSATYGTINIKSGTIYAQGTAAAGIGGGGTGSGGTVNITGGVVNATGGDASDEKAGAAGIGGMNSAADSGTVKISGGAKVTAKGSLFGGAGIGGGYSSPNGIVEISGDGTKVIAYGGGGGAGIGGGSFGLGGGGTVKITQGADVTAIGDNRGAGIGAGQATSASGAILTLDSTVTIKAFSAQADQTDGGKPGIHTQGNEGNVPYINAVLDKDYPIAKLEFRKIDGSFVGSVDYPSRSSSNYYYRDFAFTNPSMAEMGPYYIYAYNAAGQLLGQVHLRNGTAPQSAQIPAVTKGATARSTATLVKLGDEVLPPVTPSAGTLVVSEITSGTALFTNTGHNLDGADYVAGYFRYSTTVDGQGKPTGGMQLQWQSTFPDAYYSLPVSSLTPSTKYYGYTVLETSAGTVVGDVVEFTTPALDAIYYTVKFDSRGRSTVSDATVEAGSKLTRPTEPTKFGSVFLGWCRDANGINQWNFSTDTVTGDMTLYAKWSSPQIMYTVDFYATGGLPSPDPVQAEAGSRIDKPPDPIKTGFVLLGWYGEISYITKWNFNTDTVTGNMSLYAKWGPAQSYTVTFNSHGGSTVPSVTIPYYSLVPQPNNPTRSGYTFAGWYWEETHKTPFPFDIYKLTSDIELHAKWSGDGNNHTVTYNTRGGTPIPSQVSVAHNGKLTKPTDPTKSSTGPMPQIFMGWYKEPECINTWDFANHTVTEDMTLYAGWLYGNTVTFNAMGGAPTPPQITVDWGDLITPPSPAPTKVGFDLEGWYREPNCVNVWNFGNDRTPAGDMTLYAKWVSPLVLTLLNTTTGDYTNLAHKFFYTVYVYDSNKDPIPDGTVVQVRSISGGTASNKVSYTVSGGKVGGSTFGLSDSDVVEFYLPNASGGTQVRYARVVRETITANGDLNYTASYLFGGAAAVTNTDTGKLDLNGEDQIIAFNNNRSIVPTGISSGDRHGLLFGLFGVLLPGIGVYLGTICRKRKRSDSDA